MNDDVMTTYDDYMAAACELESYRPTLYRGIVWTDVLADIEADERARQEAAACA